LASGKRKLEETEIRPRNCPVRRVILRLGSREKNTELAKKTEAGTTTMMRGVNETQNKEHHGRYALSGVPRETGESNLIGQDSVSPRETRGRNWQETWMKPKRTTDLQKKTTKMRGRQIYRSTTGEKNVGLSRGKPKP